MKRHSSERCRGILGKIRSPAHAKLGRAASQAWHSVPVKSPYEPPRGRREDGPVFKVARLEESGNDTVIAERASCSAEN